MKQNWTNKKHRKSLRHRPIIYPHLFAGLFFVVLLIGISFMSELQNTTKTVHAVDNESSGESQDEIVAAVNNFYNYQRLYGCMQKYNDAPDNHSNKIDMSAVLYKDGNMGGGSSYVVDIVPDITHEGKVRCTIPYMQGIIDELSPESNIDLEQLVKDKVGESGAGDCKNINSTSPDCWNKVTGDDMVSVLSPIVNNLAHSYSDRSLTDAEKFWVYNTAFDTCTEDPGDTSATLVWGKNIRGGGPIYTNSIDATNTKDYWVFDNGSTLNPGEDGKLKTEKVYAKRLHSEIAFDIGGEAIEHTVWPGAEEPQPGAKYSGGHNMTCKDIAAMVEQFFPAYVNALNNSGEPIADYQGGTTTDAADEEEDACEAQLLGFGWLLCPGSNLVEKFLNNFLNAIGDNLEWTLLTTKGDEIRTRWQDFLNIANIAFAIVFLVMIYSMATSTGLSNYDVKKMLPNLIVVAIAVNLSFYLCAALVDISNIAGSGLFNILSGGKGRWDGSIGIEGLLADAGATIFFVIGAIFFFGISALIALAIIFICLCVREIALIALIVISPLAIVCYLLPNTKKWFKEWTDLFTQLLLVYPMYMAVWGAAAWVSDLAGGGDVLGGSSSIPAFAIQCVCLIAPAVAVVPLFKMSGGIMGMAASKVAGSKLAARGQAAQGYMRNRGKQAYHNSMIGRGIDRHRERAKDLDKQVNEGSYAGYNPWRRARQAINRGVNKIPVIGGAKGVSSDKDLGNFLKNYTYADWKGNVQHLTDDQMLDYVQGRAVKDADGRIVLAAQNLNAEQIGSGIKALSGNALEDVSGKTTTGGAPVAATDASKRYAHLQATSYMHEMYAKHGIDIGKGNPSDAYKQLSDLATSGSYVDKSGTKHTFGSHSPVRSDAAEMKRRFDANAGSADAEKIFNEEAKSFQTKRQSSAIKTTISGFTDAAAKRESDEISQALGSAMKAREFKKNAFKSGTSTPPSP